MELQEVRLLRVGDAIPEEEEPPSAEKKGVATNVYLPLQQTSQSESTATLSKTRRGMRSYPLRKPSQISDYPIQRNATAKQLVISMQSCSA